MAGEKILALAVCAIIATLSFTKPHWLWRLRNFGWGRGGEPTEFAYAMIYFQGVMAIIFGIIVLCLPIKS